MQFIFFKDIHTSICIHRIRTWTGQRRGDPDSPQLLDQQMFGSFCLSFHLFLALNRKESSRMLSLRQVGSNSWTTSVSVPESGPEPRNDWFKPFVSKVLTNHVGTYLNNSVYYLFWYFWYARDIQMLDVKRSLERMCWRLTGSPCLVVGPWVCTEELQADSWKY